MCAEEGSEEKIDKEGTSEGTLSDRKIGGVLMSVCMCVKVYCTCFALL